MWIFFSIFSAISCMSWSFFPYIFYSCFFSKGARNIYWVSLKQGISNNQSTPVFLPGESHGRTSLVGYSPRGRKESDTTEWLHLTSPHLTLWKYFTQIIEQITFGKVKYNWKTDIQEICSELKMTWQSRFIFIFIIWLWKGCLYKCIFFWHL